MFPSQREQLTHVHAVRYFYLRFRVHAAKLDQALHIWARQFLNFKGIGPDPEMERAIARYALAKLLGVDQELAVLTNADVMDPTSLEEAYEFLVEQPLFANPTEDYLSFLSMVDGALNALAPPPLHAPDSADLDDESNDNEEALPDNATA